MKALIGLLTVYTSKRSCHCPVLSQRKHEYTNVCLVLLYRSSMELAARIPG